MQLFDHINLCIQQYSSRDSLPVKCVAVSLIGYYSQSLSLDQLDLTTGGHEHVHSTGHNQA